MTHTEYQIRDLHGRVIATHHRLDNPPSPKKVWWSSPSDPHHLPAHIGTADLPLYIPFAAAVPADPIIIVEGEKSAEALGEIDIYALGTVTGAGSAPKPEAIAPQVRGRMVLAWPDADDAGRLHMDKVLRACRKAGATATGIIDYQSDIARLPKGFDAYDLVHGLDPRLAREIVGLFISNWAVQWEPSLDDFAIEVIERGTDHLLAESVSDALYAVYGLDAKPGATVRCPVHEDRSASLWIAHRDDRAICMTPTCPWAKPGADALVIKNARIDLS